MPLSNGSRGKDWVSDCVMPVIFHRLTPTESDSISGCTTSPRNSSCARRSAVAASGLFRRHSGVGYARFSEDIGDISLKYSGFGFHADLGVEYKLTRHIGIGIGAGAYIASFGTMEYPSAEYAPTANAGTTQHYGQRRPAVLFLK